jgi:hypothetical protein
VAASPPQVGSSYGLGDGFVGRETTERSGGKSLPCRGAAGFGGSGSATGVSVLLGTGSTPINALGGCARSISRCLFLRLRSVTPWNIAARHWENRKRHYNIGDSRIARDGMYNALFLRHRMTLVESCSAFRSTISVCIATIAFGGNWCRERGVRIARYPVSLLLTLRS